jgi:hypothetical protein
MPSLVGRLMAQMRLPQWSSRNIGSVRARAGAARTEAAAAESAVSTAQRALAENSGCGEVLLRDVSRYLQQDLRGDKNDLDDK